MIGTQRGVFFFHFANTMLLTKNHRTEITPRDPRLFWSDGRVGSKPLGGIYGGEWGEASNVVSTLHSVRCSFGKTFVSPQCDFGVASSLRLLGHTRSASMTQQSPGWRQPLNRTSAIWGWRLPCDCWDMLAWLCWTRGALQAVWIGHDLPTNRASRVAWGNFGAVVLS